jgi:hypothetical protein
MPDRIIASHSGKCPTSLSRSAAIPNSKNLSLETAGLFPRPTRKWNFRVNSKNRLKPVKPTFPPSIMSNESAQSGLALLTRNFEFRVSQQQHVLNLEVLVDRHRSTHRKIDVV